MKIVVRLLILSFLLSLPMSYGCSRQAIAERQEKKRRKELAKKQEQKEWEAQAAYEDALKRYYDMQTKETRKVMRQNMKKSQALRENKKTCFIKRWFSPKQRKKHPNRKT